MTILVTGATGFVGSAVARRLVRHGFEVRVLVRPDSDRHHIDGLDVDVSIGDLVDRGSLESAAKGCTALFHVAADYRLWTRDPQGMFATNVDGTRDVLRAAAEAGATRIVYTSSVAVLGSGAAGDPADEETPVAFDEMIGPYKQSKFRAEAEVRRLVADEGIPVVIVNPSMPVGPGDVKPTPTGRMIVEAASGRVPAYVDSGLNVVHVDDVAMGHLLAFERGEVGERYVLGGEDMSLREILCAVTAAAGRRPPRLRLPHGVVLPVAYAAEAWSRLSGGREPFVTVDGVRMARKRMYYSSAKARRALGYNSSPALGALGDAVAWFRENGYCS